MKLKQWILVKFQEWKNNVEIELRESRIRRAVPWNCYTCELLGICRDEHNKWKCRHGCLVLNAEERGESTDEANF